MSARPLLKPFLNPQFSTTDVQRTIQVCILGASSKLGRFTSFLMKQNPLISIIHLQGCYPLDNMGVDLNFIDTRCKVRTYCGLEPSVPKAIKGADIVLFLPSEDCNATTPLADRILTEGRKIYNNAVQCSLYAPRAILLVAVPPVSVFTPLVGEILKKTNFYHPGRIIGSAAIAQVKANALLGRFQELDPVNCSVDVVGGPEIDLCVPLFSAAKPIEVFGPRVRTLTAMFRCVNEEEFPKNLGNPNYVDECVLAESYALNQLVWTIGLGILGDPVAMGNVFVRSNTVSACRHFLNSVRFGRGGVVHNCGLPTLTKFELDLVERAAIQIAEREQMAADYLKFIEETPDRMPPFAEKERHEQELLKQKVIR